MFSLCFFLSSHFGQFQLSLVTHKSQHKVMRLKVLITTHRAEVTSHATSIPHLPLGKLIAQSCDDLFLVMELDIIF